jgi:hypothetical protein
MLDWLKRLWKKPVLTGLTVLGLSLGIPWMILKVVSTLSDVGFSIEIANYRWKILLAAGITGVLAVALYLYWFLYYQQNTFRSEIRKLHQEIQDLNAQKDSVLRLMERYRSEAQESIFKRLQDLALSGILAPVWKEKGAKVQHFRVERSDGTAGLQATDSLNRVTVFINLSEKDSVMIGMRFFVQDPVDFKKYGTIVITECHEQGSTCSIVDTEHTGFWTPVIKALQSPTDAEIINAMPNVITPASPYQQLNDETAAELLDWLNKLENVEL